MRQNELHAHSVKEHVYIEDIIDITECVVSSVIYNWVLPGARVRRCLEGREKVKTKLKLMEEEIRKVPPSRVMKTRARV